IEPIYSYHIFEKGHRFLVKNGKNFRENEIWRNVVDRRSGETEREELIVANFSEVLYDPPNVPAA
ncbi:MAG TPA: vancomycin resistance protein, partial [Blastocatellia bacterium]|nr:vancomycin resistance protein [Blastocatellia bacterium]